MRRRRVAARLMILGLAFLVGLFAYGSRASAAGPCLIDSFDSVPGGNDTQATASLVTLPFSAGLTLCHGEEDWFSFFLWAGSQVQVDALFSHASGDIDIFLHDAAGTAVNWAQSFTDNEKVIYTVPASDTYAVRVGYLVSGTPPKQIDYTLEISVSCPDGFEDNDTQGTASPVSLPFDQPGLRVCWGDDDWFSFPLSAGDEVQVDAFFSDASGDIDIFLHDAAGTAVAWAQSYTDNEKVTYTVPASGTYAVTVNLKGPGPGNQYRLRISIPCADDGFEDNDTQGTASPVGLPFDQPGLRVCPGDDDWFSFPLAAGDQIQIDAFFSHASGDIDILLYDPAGSTVVAGSITITDDEKITYTAPASGTYAVTVDVTGPPAGNQYRLRISALPSALLIGDVDCNGIVNSIDAALLLQFGAGLVPSLACQGAADVSADGNINSIDAALVLQYDAGLILSLPP